MLRSRKIKAFTFGVIALMVVAAALIYRLALWNNVTVVTGVVLQSSTDSKRERPVAQATVTAVSGDSVVQAKSDHTGLFRLQLPPASILDEPAHFTFEHPEYHPVELPKSADERIYVVRLDPRTPEAVARPREPMVSISNVRVRYALKNITTVDVGSAVKAFTIVNTGNVPCDTRGPCSPDRKWRAAIGSISLDAGDGRQFRNIRVTCIAGPCPFTKIESEQQTQGGRLISVSVRNWSDTVTYVFEAEVAHTMASELIRHSYPVIYGNSMNFTLPAAAQGPSIEAELDGTEIVFPVGPALILSWATCRLERGPDRSQQYRCELKPQYQFK
jgi:hypothetical protein